MSAKTSEADIRHLPSYAIGEASHYLRIPKSTMRAWVRGTTYSTTEGRRGVFQQVIHRPRDDDGRLSFVNLVEAHVLDAVRREHRISLQKVRIAIRYVREEFGSQYPLAEQKFETDGIDLFMAKFDQLINVSRAGQLAIRELLRAHLQRIDHDELGLPIRLFPFTRARLSTDHLQEPRAVVIDPYVSFGRPVLAGTGIPTVVIAERYKAGEAIEELGADYGLESLEVQEAIRCELFRTAA